MAFRPSVTLDDGSSQVVATSRRGTVKLTHVLSASNVDRLEVLAEHFKSSRSAVLDDLLTSMLDKTFADLLGTPTAKRPKNRTGRPRRPISTAVVAHTPGFKPKRGRPRADGIRFGYAVCTCGWSSTELRSEGASLRNAATHARHYEGPLT